MDKNIEIFFLEDENGEQQVIKEIARIVKLSSRDEGYKELSKYILEGMEFLRTVGIPKNKNNLPFVTRKKDGTLLTFASIIKRLKHHPPLMEFRINWRGTGYFRAIFFYTEDIIGNQKIYFTKALVKIERNPPEFERFILLSKEILKKYKERYPNERI